MMKQVLVMVFGNGIEKEIKLREIQQWCDNVPSDKRVMRSFRDEGDYLVGFETPVKK